MAYQSNHPSAAPGSWGPESNRAPAATQVPPPYAGNSQPQVVYVQTPHVDFSGKQMSVEKMTVPLLMFFGALSVVVGLSVFATRTATTLEQGITTLTATLNNYIVRADDRMTRLENDITKRTTERWTKTDHELFCARTEALPANKGWRCARTHDGLRADEPPIWTGMTGSVDEPQNNVADNGIGAWSNPKVRATP